MVLALQSRRKGTNDYSLKSPVVDEVSTRSGHQLDSLLYVYFRACVTNDIRHIQKPCVPLYPDMYSTGTKTAELIKKPFGDRLM